MADQVDAQQAADGAVSALGSSQWSEHSAPNGRKYYYNGVTGESTWERCVWLDFYVYMLVWQGYFLSRVVGMRQKEIFFFLAMTIS